VGVHPLDEPLEHHEYVWARRGVSGLSVSYPSGASDQATKRPSDQATKQFVLRSTGHGRVGSTGSSGSTWDHATPWAGSSPHFTHVVDQTRPDG
jgi:hypothetical protein